ncbi:MAG: histidine kinase [Planctomycetes bacterium]|nr:histidine kinase [Planctomycetota bacterium]
MTPLTNQASRDDLNRYFCGFHTLMPFRVEHVLLVCSLYESFVLEEDGLLSELITSEFLDMNLSQAPRVSRVSTGQEALQFLDIQNVDLVITMTRLGDLSVVALAEAIRENHKALPIIVLADEPRSIMRQPGIKDGSAVDQVFLWDGDTKILLAIIKFVEDQLNVEHDTREGNVRVILLVENSIRFYSSFLPLIYTEVMKLTQALIADSVNMMHRLLRMRARPRILLAETFEDASNLCERYGDNLLGLISDVRFPRNGELDSHAGLELASRVRAKYPHLPVLLQSSDPAYAAAADELGVFFVRKKSRNLMRRVREFLLNNLGFGDFIFKMPDGSEVGRAQTVLELEEGIARVPGEALSFHANHNHFSNWLMARTEFDLAARLRTSQVSDFQNIDQMREHLVRELSEFRARSQTGVITDFSPRKFDVTSSFTRIGSGSIGGKARGLAFVNALLRHHSLGRKFEGAKVFVPNSATLGTDVFDTFLDENSLRGFVAEDVTDARITQMFLAAKLPREIYKDLTAFLRFVRYPLAVRSSSLLEDSHGRPFAGVYETHMVQNNHPDISVRLDQLCDAIKRVYASTFSQRAKQYLEATGRNVEQERMAVILQELVGSNHKNRFYPTFSGVARSYNFYPQGNLTSAEGIASVALGLGKTVVEGGQTLMFSPAHPEVLPQFPTTKDLLANSQRKFFAVDTSHPEVYPTDDAAANLVLLDLEVAERDGTLAPVGSVYSSENDRVYDGIRRAGPRLVTFAHVLKANAFPLADILSTLLQLGSEGMAGPIEMEFAVDMSTTPMEFGFLQIRPIIVHEEFSDVGLDEVDRDSLICFSDRALGNGKVDGITDVVYVKPDAFDNTQTRDIAADIAHINDGLQQEERTSILIGPGRWGTADRFLGIPVTWEQISSAQLIVETNLKDFCVIPSQGTHFFQNLTSLGVGYLTVDPHIGDSFVNWKWLEQQTALKETKYTRHIRFDEPVQIRIDGRNQRGIICQPSPVSD